MSDINEMASKTNRRTIAILITQGETMDDLELENVVAKTTVHFVPVAVTEKCNIIDDT